MSEDYFISHITSTIWVSSWMKRDPRPRMSGLLWFRVFCTFVVTSLMNSSFPTFLFSLPISHFFISFFLVFSLFFIFNPISALTKQQFCFSTYHTSHITKIHAVSSINQYVIHLVTYFVRWSPGNLVNGHMLILCSCHSYISSQCRIYHSFSIVICFIMNAVPSTCWIFRTG
jgi:hypothetical protein